MHKCAHMVNFAGLVTYDMYNKFSFANFVYKNNAYNTYVMWKINWNSSQIKWLSHITDIKFKLSIAWNQLGINQYS